jgi:hypothetical protein
MRHSRSELFRKAEGPAMKRSGNWMSDANMLIDFLQSRGGGVH